MNNLEKLLDWAKSQGLFIEICGDGSCEIAFQPDPMDSYVALARGPSLLAALQTATIELSNYESI